MGQSPNLIIRVCPEHLCRLLATHRILERVEAGELGQELGREPTPTDFIDREGQRCIQSEEWLVFDPAFVPGDPRRQVVRAHCYRTSDGRIGASGKLDPKDMMVPNPGYGTDPTAKEYCEYRLMKKNTLCILCEGGDMIPPEERFRDSKYRPGATDAKPE